VAALRRNSREIVEAARSSSRAISRTPAPRARNKAMCSRSVSDKYLPVGGVADGANCDGGIPPHSRNHLVPTGCDTPAFRAASSLEQPWAIACQNGRRRDRCNTGGRPGDLIFARPARADRRLFVIITTSFGEVLQRSVESAQYTSYAFGKRCREAGVMPSMGSVGDAYDNAMAESFFASLERELLNRRRFKSQAEAKMAVFEWIEGWYNPHRRHSALGYRSPVNYERVHAMARAA
jgi:putative transposase